VGVYYYLLGMCTTLVVYTSCYIVVCSRWSTYDLLGLENDSTLFAGWMSKHPDLMEGQIICHMYMNGFLPMEILRNIAVVIKSVACVHVCTIQVPKSSEGL
jgi:hypothetical protein